MVEDHFSIAGFFVKGHPKSDNLWPYTTVHLVWRKPSKYCYAHSQNLQNRWEIQPVVPCFLQLPYHLTSNSFACFLSFARSSFFVFSFWFFFSLSFFFLSFFLYLSLPLSLSLSFLWQMSFEKCHMFEGLFSNILSDNLATTICCTRSPGHAIEPFP